MEDRIHRLLCMSDPLVQHHNEKDILRLRKKKPMDPDVAKLLKNPEDAETWGDNINFWPGGFEPGVTGFEEEEENEEPVAEKETLNLTLKEIRLDDLEQDDEEVDATEESPTSKKQGEEGTDDLAEEIKRTEDTGTKKEEMLIEEPKNINNVVEPDSKTYDQSRSLATNETPADRRKDDNTYRRGALNGKGGKFVPKKKKPKEKTTYRAKAEEDSTEYDTDDNCESKMTKN